MIKFLILLTLFSCSSIPTQNSNAQDKKVFNYVDASGKYLYSRESKVQGQKIITRTVVMSDKRVPLESSVLLSKLGSVKGEERLAVLPEASQFYVWFNKKKFKTQIKVKSEKRKVVGKITNPDEGDKNFEFDLKKGRYYCFFSQLPECIEKQNIILEARTKRIFIYIIWDNYPFNSEQYEQIPETVVSLAQFSFSKKHKNSLAFELDLGNQVIIYHFDRQLKFEKMFWIAQGISITKEGT